MRRMIVLVVACAAMIAGTADAQSLLKKGQTL